MLRFSLSQPARKRKGKITSVKNGPCLFGMCLGNLSRSVLILTDDDDDDDGGLQR